jgi:hypothetical protein
VYPVVLSDNKLEIPVCPKVQEEKFLPQEEVIASDSTDLSMNPSPRLTNTWY